jgi:hypothetical protein
MLGMIYTHKNMSCHLSVKLRCRRKNEAHGQQKAVHLMAK